MSEQSKWDCVVELAEKVLVAQHGLEMRQVQTNEKMDAFQKANLEYDKALEKEREAYVAYRVASRTLEGATPDPQTMTNALKTAEANVAAKSK